MIEEVDEEVSEPIEKQEIWQKESQEVERLDKAMREMRLAIREREREREEISSLDICTWGIENDSREITDD